MYFRNDSNFQVGLRTKKEVLTFKPGEVKEIMESDIIQLNSKLVKISESDIVKKQEVKNSKEDIQKEVLKENQVEEENVSVVVDNEQAVVQNDEQDVKDAEAEIEAKVDVKEDEKSQEKIDNKVKEQFKRGRVKKDPVKDLEELKDAWMKAKTAKEKETIQKKIKELQAKIK